MYRAGFTTFTDHCIIKGLYCSQDLPTRPLWPHSHLSATWTSRGFHPIQSTSIRYSLVSLCFASTLGNGYVRREKRGRGILYGLNITSHNRVQKLSSRFDLTLLWDESTMRNMPKGGMLHTIQEARKTVCTKTFCPNCPTCCGRRVYSYTRAWAETEMNAKVGWWRNCFQLPFIVLVTYRSDITNRKSIYSIYRLRWTTMCNVMKKSKKEKKERKPESLPYKKHKNTWILLVGLWTFSETKWNLRAEMKPKWLVCC